MNQETGKNLQTTMKSELTQNQTGICKTWKRTEPSILRKSYHVMNYIFLQEIDGMAITVNARFQSSITTATSEVVILQMKIPSSAAD